MGFSHFGLKVRLELQIKIVSECVPGLSLEGGVVDPSGFFFHNRASSL